MRSAAVRDGANAAPSALSTRHHHLAAGGRRQAAGRRQQFQRDVGQRVALDFGQQPGRLGRSFQQSFLSQNRGDAGGDVGFRAGEHLGAGPGRGRKQLADRDQRRQTRRRATAGSSNCVAFIAARMRLTGTYRGG